MNRTKLAALLAAVALTLFAVGCGGDSTNNANTGNATRSNTNATNVNK